MSRNFDKDEFKILVGVRFDSQMEKLIEYAKVFSKSTGAKIRLTHAVEPWKDNTWLSTFPTDDLYRSVAASVETQMLEEAKTRIKALKDSLKEFEIETHVAIGASYEILNTDALRSRCSLIVVAADDKETNYQMMPQGFSTALSLMSKSQVPVMVIPSGYETPVTLEEAKILCADDLLSRGMEALGVSVELSSCFKRSKIHHAHVCHETKGSLADIGKKVIQWMTEGKVPYSDSFQEENLTDQVIDRTEDSLGERFQQARRNAGAPETDYEKHVLFGAVQDELRVMVEQNDPNFIVLGRHEFLHSKPFTVGKLPQWAMFSFQRPIIVAAPPEKLTVGQEHYQTIRGLSPTLA